MLRDYRDWLEGELKLLGNASHHAYAFGQANMAKRALERLDADLAQTLYVALDPLAARRALVEMALLAQRSTAEHPELAALRQAIKTALAEAEPPDGEEPDAL